MLCRMSSRELSEWRVYEQEYGQLGPRYEQELLRQIHAQLQYLAYLYAASKTEKGKRNPVPEPKLLPGPDETEELEELDWQLSWDEE